MSKKEKILSLSAIILIVGYLLPITPLSIIMFFIGWFILILGLIVKD